MWSVMFQRGKNQHVESSRHTSAGLGLHLLQRGLLHKHNAHLWSQGSKTSVGPQPSFSPHHHCKLSIPITFSCILIKLEMFQPSVSVTDVTR